MRSRGSYNTAMVSRLPDSPPPMDTKRKPRSRRKRMRVRRLPVSVLPTMLTLGNVLCGFAAVFFASRTPGEAELPFGWTPLTFAAGLIFLGMDLLRSNCGRGPVDSLAPLIRGEPIGVCAVFHTPVGKYACHGTAR